jgi:surfeit locus 1 family protein
VSLGLWQLQRLDWKDGHHRRDRGRIGAPPSPFPRRPIPTATATFRSPSQGGFTGDQPHVLVSTRDQGAGHRIISAFETEDGRRVLVDEGYVRLRRNDAPARPEASSPSPATSTGRTRDRFTPEPDLSEGLFFARDVPAMAAALGTEPVLIVARTVDGTAPRAQPMPVTAEGIPNDHLGYAIQWFGLAAVWAGDDRRGSCGVSGSGPSEGTSMRYVSTRGRPRSSASKRRC